MKALACLVAAGLLLAGCADPLEKRKTEEVGAQLQRGISGQGQIGPIERQPGDQANEHGIPQTHP